MNYTTKDASPKIFPHAIHWVACYESYDNYPPRHNIDGWALLQAASNRKYTIYRRYNQVIIAFPGTVGAEDIMNDAILSTPSGSNTFPNAVEAIVYVKNLISSIFTDPEIVITVTGHSKGGAVARVVAESLGLGVVTFNAAAPPTAPVRNNLVGSVNYHIVFDPISAWQSPCVRLDNGYRPSSKRAIPLIGIFLKNHFKRTAIVPMLEAHRLDNFSKNFGLEEVNERFEDNLWKEWFNGLPKVYKVLWLLFIGAPAISAP